MRFKCNNCGDITEEESIETRSATGLPMPKSGWGCWKCFKGEREPIKKEHDLE